MELLYMNSHDAKKNFKKDSIGIIVIGSIEQHGAHAPLGTDFIIPNFLANSVKKEMMSSFFQESHMEYAHLLKNFLELLILVMKIY